jgi:hypothetical protein
MPTITTELVAALLREGAVEPELCLDDEDDCFAKHPAHMLWAVDNVVTGIAADVDVLAGYLATKLNALVSA